MTRIITFSGFLGAGKTTAISELANYYTNIHKKVTIITNDQGSNLVDTSYLSSQGYSTKEIFGGCFCCNFKDMLSTIMTIKTNDNPDIILAEAVGSCTDLYATVVKPLHTNHSDLFSIAPLVTLVDPYRVMDLYESTQRIFPHEVTYLLKKQIEESGHLLISKEDLIQSEDTERIISLLRANGYVHTIDTISSVTGKGIKSLGNSLLTNPYKEMPIMDLDYDLYTTAEKHLGWFNMNLSIEGSSDIVFKDLASDFLSQLRELMIQEHSEIAHLKLYASHGTDSTKVSLTSNKGLIIAGQTMKHNWSSYDLTINARVHINPDKLKSSILSELKQLGHTYRFNYKTHYIESFMPGEPDANARQANMAI